MNHSPFGAKIAVSVAQLQPWPLPRELVIDGEPNASGSVLSKSPDVRVVRGIWDCTPGKFRWDWNYDETIVVVSGREIDDEIPGVRKMPAFEAAVKSQTGMRRIAGISQLSITRGVVISD